MIFSVRANPAVVDVEHSIVSCILTGAKSKLAEVSASNRFEAHVDLPATCVCAILN